MKDISFEALSLWRSNCRSMSTTKLVPSMVKITGSLSLFMFVLLFQVLKKFAAVGFQHFGHSSFGHGLHQTVFTIFLAEGEYFDTAEGPHPAGQAEADDGSGPGDIEDGKERHQADDKAAEIPDVLGLQAAEFDALIDAFVDVVNA